MTKFLQQKYALFTLSLDVQMRRHILPLNWQWVSKANLCLVNLNNEAGANSFPLTYQDKKFSKTGLLTSRVL